MTEDVEGGRLRARGEEALGDLAQALMDNPLVGQALSRAIGAGERAAHAQRTALGALNIPASTDVERLEQRLRSVSNRLEAIEDQLDEVADEVAALARRVVAAEKVTDGPAPRTTAPAGDD